VAIKLERIRIGLTQRQLAEIIGVTELTIGKYEQNPQQASGRNLIKLADLFDCSVDYLLGRTEERGGPKNE